MTNNMIRTVLHALTVTHCMGCWNDSYEDALLIAEDIDSMSDEELVHWYNLVNKGHVLEVTYIDGKRVPVIR